MSGFGAVAGVTRTLARVLQRETTVAVETTQSPADTIADNPSKIHLYCYRVEPNRFFRNADWLHPTPTQQQPPPLGVNVHYLVTPYGSDQLEIQRTLGDVLQVVHEMPIIDPVDFDAAIADTTEELRVLWNAMSHDALVDFWRSFAWRSRSS
jgi:hypothetical protein